MIFSYDWLKQYTKLPKPEKLAQLLTMHSFEVESVNKIKGDHVLDIDVLPNRGPDCFSHIGIAREIAAITISNFQFPISKIKEDKKLKTKDFIAVEVRNKKDCLRYTARVLINVKVKDSPKWIKEKIKACGLRPINNIVDAANYVMLETGQPLHAFDLDKISNKKIIIRRAQKNEKIITLDDDKYLLDKDILVIADDKDLLAIAGIKGGKKAEIDKKTKTVILESANFDSKVIRHGSKKIGLRTDASWRFENKIDPNLTEIAVNRLAELVQDLAPGKIASGLVDFYPKKNKPKKVKLNLKYLEKLLGIKISKKEVKNILERLGFKVKELSSLPAGRQGLNLEIGVPSFRLDISLPEDLIEEVSRIYGYEKISDAFPVASLIPPEKNLEIFWESCAKNVLKELEFSEVYNYSFIGDKDFKLLKCSSKEIIELENPISRDQKYLRPSLIPNLLNNVEENFKYFEDIKIFEIGKIFNKRGEKTMLTGLIAGKYNKDQFYHLKGEMDYLFHKHGIANVWYDEHKPTPEQSKICLWQKGKCAEIKVGNQEIGFLGEVSPSLLKQGKVVVFDIDFEKFRELCSEEWEYQPVSQYPSTIRDLAILVPINVKVIEVMNIINNIGGSLIKDIDLFDIYEGERLDYNRKSLAFHIIYQADNRTLRASEINTIQNKIIKTLEKKSQWQVRK